MSGKLIALAAASALLVSAGAVNAKDPVKLTNGQLDKVTAGARNVQLPVATSFVANGAGGGGLLSGGGVNSFSPSTATVTQSINATALNLFTVN